MQNMVVKTCQEGVSAQNSIFVRTLGAFSLSLQNFEDGTFEEEPINIAGRGRRIWMLIAYLVIHRDRDVPINELFEVLWNESQKRANPLKTLQHNVSRARDALANVGLPNARELIVAHAGAYRWNPQRATLVDLDYFQSCIAQADLAQSDKERIDLLKRASDVYRGDFLPGFEGESWVAPMSAYGHSAYITECLTLTRLLNNEEHLSEVAAICERALRFAPESEELSIRYIRALTALGYPEKAVSVFENINKLLNDKLGVVPSSELQLAYEEAHQAISGEVVPINSICCILNEEALAGKGMRCDWNSFLSLVRREACNTSRAKRSAVVVAISYGDSKNTELDARRVETILSQHLRGGDVYTRLNAKQFLVLLSEAGEENIEAILHRLQTAFRNRFPRSDARISSEWYVLANPASTC